MKIVCVFLALPHPESVNIREHWKQFEHSTQSTSTFGEIPTQVRQGLIDIRCTAVVVEKLVKNI